MRYTVREGLLWIGLLLLLHAALLVLFVVDPPDESRGFLFEFGAGLGFLGMGFFVAQFITTGRFPRVAPSYGSDIVLQFHRFAGIAGVVLIVLHPVFIIIADPSYVRFFDPTDNFFRAAGMFAVSFSIMAILLTSVSGVPKWMNYEQWRLAHAALAVAIVFIGMVHGLQVGHYLDTLWKQLIWVASVVFSIGLLVEVRLLRPLRMRRHPYRVVSVKPERGNAWTLELAPVGHEGLDFEAGQFAWISVGDSPFQLQQNPFSIGSATGDTHLLFTAAVAGDFTASLPTLKPGDRAWIDGAYGSFTIPENARGLYFIAGGSGVVPVLSILRTMDKRKDLRPVTLLYGNPRLEEVLFYDELNDLQSRLNLKVVHFLEDDVPDEDGFEKGFITKDHIDRYLPNDENRYAYYTCGPAPLMNIAEKSL
ncbi:MAG: ferric reductase-like transmembrane domain-containing protein, partial [Balneolales bacterium]|nr:ferric reductase-like transmembrane domain-containing protein [Balneolales bacterium]